MSFLKSYKFVILGFLVFLIGFGAYVGVSQHRQGLVAGQLNEIAELENKQTTLESAMKGSQIEAVRSGSGIDLERVARDDVEIEELAKDIFTWNSYESYHNARLRAMNEYGIEEDSHLLTSFMPELYLAEDGTNVIDAMGTNLHYGAMESRVAGIDGGTYHYFTIITVTSSDKNGAGASGDLILEYETSPENEIMNIRAYR